MHLPLPHPGTLELNLPPPPILLPLLLSAQTAEIGMTENVGDSGLRFEIWFRRRKSQDTFILQASSSEVKAVWTAIIGKILWRQALRNRGDSRKCLP